MAKKKKEDSEEIPRPTEDIRTEKPVFKKALSDILKKNTIPKKK